MGRSRPPVPQHPRLTRRRAIQAGSIGLLGLGMNHLDALRAAVPERGENARADKPPMAPPRARACIYIFLSGGLAQQDSFDLKPDAPDAIRGEFQPIATATPGIEICEHLPLLAQRSRHWSLVRSLTHPTNGHTEGHFFMLTGRSTPPPGFVGDRMPRSTDWPSIASVAGDWVRRYPHPNPLPEGEGVSPSGEGNVLPSPAGRGVGGEGNVLPSPTGRGQGEGIVLPSPTGRGQGEGQMPGTPRNNLPPAVVLPERLVHWSGGVIPGAYGGLMGRQRDPWFIEASPYGNPFWRGAYPEYTFPNQSKLPPQNPDDRVYQAPNLSLPEGLSVNRLHGRLGILASIEGQRRQLEAAAEIESFDRHRQSAISLLADPKVRWAFDVTKADDKAQERYGRNSFGWSLLMAYRLVVAGVSLVQVNLGNNETWDTHGDAFPRLRDKLFPPTDKALSALLDDLQSDGLLESTLIVMAGEFGRTPRISTLPESYYGPGRDHWGAVQTVFFAGGGIRGGTVIGASDKLAAYPAANPQRPENLAATIYHSLGIPPPAVWHDELDRPHQIYHGEVIAGL